MEAADLLIKYLEQLKVDFVFGVPGGAIEPLYNALARSERRGGPKAIVARHETGAAFMADGYARNSGKLGVCCATTGPGTTNLITGVSSAYENDIPLLVITAQTSQDKFGRKAFQESTDTGVNTVGMFQFCTVYNTLVSDVEQLEHKLISAINIAFTRSRPSHLSIPINVLSKEITRNSLFNTAAMIEPQRVYDLAVVNRLGCLIRESKKIVFVMGARCSEAADIILAIALKINASVVTTPDGKGLVNPYHPLFRGVIGFAGHETALETLVDFDVDLVVAIGTSLGEWSSNGWDEKALLNHRLVHVESMDIDCSNVPMAKFSFRGDITSIFLCLQKEFLEINNLRENFSYIKDADTERDLKFHFKEIAYCSFGEEEKDRKPVKPQWLMKKLPSYFPCSAKYFSDTGNSTAWAIHYLHPDYRKKMSQKCIQSSDMRGSYQHKRNGFLQVAIEFASMGWAIGAAVGASFANPREVIVCLTGDGSFLMSGQEITVAIEYQLPVIFIILNDGCLGMVKHGQCLNGAEKIGAKLPDVNFAKMASSMGVRSFRIENTKDLYEICIDKNWLSSGPTLLDISIDADEIPPIGSRVETLKKAQST